MWQHFFGAGIVKTAEDFGVQSEYPIHGELLDWLAVEFRERGWSMKAHAPADRHQRHVSAVEPRDARASRPRPREPAAMPAASRFRMPSLILRDWALAAAGLLDPRIGGTPGLSVPARRDLGGAGDHQGARLHLPGLLGRRPVSPQPLHVLAADGRPGQHVRRLEPAGLPRAVRRRPARRCTPSPRSTTRPGSRPRGCWPSRALKVGERRGRPADARLPSRAWPHADGRRPGDRCAAPTRNRRRSTQTDPAGAQALLERRRVAKRDETLDVAEHAALSAVCLAILNLDEALTRE